MRKIRNPEEIELKPKPTNWNFKDLEGQRFGRLYVAGYLGKRFMNDPNFWLLHCDCGSYVKATTTSLTSGRVTNCGCLNKLQKRAAREKQTSRV